MWQYLNIELAITSTIIILVMFIGYNKGDIKYITTLQLIWWIIINISTERAATATNNTYKNWNMEINNEDIRIKTLILILGLISHLIIYVKYENNISKEIEIFFIIIILSSIVIILSKDLINLYIIAELISISSYILTSLNKGRIRSIESGVKYIIIGGLTTIMMLIGIGLIYSTVGSTGYSIIKGVNCKEGHMRIGETILIISLLSKLGSVPFHMWMIDVYDGSKTKIMCWLISITKLPIFIAIYELNGIMEIGNIIILYYIVNIVVGNISGLSEGSMKRWIGYSTLNHTANILILVLIGDKLNIIKYMGIYTLIILITSSIIIILGNEKGSRYLWEISKIRKLNKGLGLMVLLGVLSNAGIPPTIGFEIKLAAYKSVMINRYTEILFIGVIISIIGVYYYLRVIEVNYFTRKDWDINIEIGWLLKKESVQRLESIIIGFYGLTMLFIPGIWLIGSIVG